MEGVEEFVKFVQEHQELLLIPFTFIVLEIFRRCYIQYLMLYKDIKINKIKKTDLIAGCIENDWNDEYQDDISLFIKTMVSNFEEDDCNNLMNNLISLIINSNNRKDYGGSYFFLTNEVMLGDDETIYHELLHMSSTSQENCDNIRIHSGFYQSSGLTYIGKGLNEGYTELLTKRYFKDHIFTFEVADSYDYLASIASLLETIISKEDMQSLYLNADLYGLVDRLKEYENEKDVITFIRNLDYILRYIESFRAFNYDKLSNKIRNTYLFLLDCYVKKLMNDLNNGLINEEQFYRLVRHYYKRSIISIKTYKNGLLSMKDLQEIIYRNMHAKLDFNRHKVRILKAY